jgi:hypothetical protein
MQMDLELKLAQYALGELPGEMAPEIAEELIRRGLESPAACELASMREPTWRDARELFEQSLAVASLRVPTRERADALVILRTLEGLADGSLDARAGAARLWDAWLDRSCPDELTRFVGCASEWDDHRESRPELEADIRECAAQLLPTFRARTG